MIKHLIEEQHFDYPYMVKLIPLKAFYHPYKAILDFSSKYIRKLFFGYSSAFKAFDYIKWVFLFYILMNQMNF